MTQILPKPELFHYRQLLKYLLLDPEISLYYFQEIHPNRGICTIHFYLKEKFPDRYLEAIDEYSSNLRLQRELKTLRQKCRLIQAKEQLDQMKDNS